MHLVFLGPEGNQGHRYVCVSVSEWAKLLMLGTCICMFVDVLPCFLDSVYLVILRKHYLYLRFSGRGDSVIGDKCEINVFKQLWVCLSAQATISANLSLLS